MKVIAHIPQFILSGRYSTEYCQLYIDFMRETCRSFDADLVFVVGSYDLMLENCRPVYDYLRAQGISTAKGVTSIGGKSLFLHPSAETSLQETELSAYDNLVIGGDDWGWDYPFLDKARIDTPDSYPLWSPVVTGIALNMAQV